MSRQDIVVVDYEATCACGPGVASLREALRERRSGLRQNDFPDSLLETWIGRVDSLESQSWDGGAAAWQSRNNALIALALAQGGLAERVAELKARYGASRVAVIMGSSTSSIDRSEEAYHHLSEDGALAPAYRQENVLNPHAPGLYVAHLLGLDGPTLTVNTACSSSAKVFASASRWLHAGLADAVLVGGADTLCHSVLQGFHSLQLVSAQPCRPFDAARDGINLGEGAGFALLQRADEAQAHTGIKVAGYGESSDAYHMSHPHPQGAGARLAIEQALAGAKLHTQDIGYINLHGTASRANDRIEGALVADMFGEQAVASSTKGWMGHTLGAAGILESLVAIEALRSECVPGTMNLEEVDPEVPLALFAENRRLHLEHVMNNSFGFGGNNACLIFSRTATSPEVAL